MNECDCFDCQRRRALFREIAEHGARAVPVDRLDIRKTPATQTRQLIGGPFDGLPTTPKVQGLDVLYMQHAGREWFLYRLRYEDLNYQCEGQISIPPSSFPVRGH